MNNVREVVCFSCENNLIADEQIYSKCSIKDLHKENIRLSKEIDSKIFSLHDRINLLDEIPESIEVLYQSFEKRKIVQKLIRISEVGRESKPGKNLFLQTVSESICSVVFYFFNAFILPTDWYTTPKVYFNVVYPLNTAVLGAGILARLADAHFIHDLREPRLDLNPDESLSRFITILHKIQNAALFNIEAVPYLDKAKKEFDQISIKEKENLPPWTIWETSLGKLLNIPINS